MANHLNLRMIWTRSSAECHKKCALNHAISLRNTEVTSRERDMAMVNGRLLISSRLLVEKAAVLAGFAALAGSEQSRRKRKVLIETPWSFPLGWEPQYRFNAGRKWLSDRACEGSGVLSHSAECRTRVLPAARCGRRGGRCTRGRRRVPRLRWEICPT